MNKIYGIYLKYISKDDIHVYSIDEVFMDITNYLKTYKKTPIIIGGIDFTSLSIKIKNLEDELTEIFNLNTPTGISITRQAEIETELEELRMMDEDINDDIPAYLHSRRLLDIQQEVGERFGADGVEISAHYPCAEDHVDIQGRQFSNEKFEKLNSK